MRGRAVAAPLLVVLACAAPGGCAWTSQVDEGGAAASAERAVVDADVVATAGQRVDGLAVRPRPRSDGSYDRDLFGGRWADVDGNGCNQRDDVLLRDAEPGSTTLAEQGACDHDVLAGTWVDPYTGETRTFDDLKDLGQAQALQVDHVVPLAEAWASGARSWSDERREAFANDLGVLLAADGPTNAAKSDDDPAAWRPRQAYQCAYAVQWIDVKARWELAVDASEVAALEEMLGTC